MLQARTMEYMDGTWIDICAAPTCSHQSFDGSSYYVDVDVDVQHSNYYIQL